MAVQKCGDIRTLYNASKLQGYVLITYYDGRAGNYAKAALDGVLLNGRQLRIEPSGPGQKIHDKDTQSGRTASMQDAATLNACAVPSLRFILPYAGPAWVKTKFSMACCMR